MLRALGYELEQAHAYSILVDELEDGFSLPINTSILPKGMCRASAWCGSIKVDGS
jgi:hypothetical protein